MRTGRAATPVMMLAGPELRAVPVTVHLSLKDAIASLTPELIDRSAICCRPRDLDDRLAYYESAGATTLLAMPFGDRPAIVDQLAAAVSV